MKPEVLLEVPRAIDPDGLALLRDDRALLIGDREEKSFEVFRKPPRASEFFEEPPFTGRAYTSRGWQLSNESFGGVFLNDRLVLGVHTIEDASPNSIQEIVRTYQERFALIPLTSVPGKYGEYMFWQTESIRLMIHSSSLPKKNSLLVVALGDADAMDALRMDEKSARQDLVELARILEPVEIPDP